LLASVYGLRRSEIVRLRLEDLDWYNEIITVRRSKRGRLQQFPLQFEVGEAIIHYIKHVRPACRSRNVFVTMHRPYRPATNIGSAIRKIMNARGILDQPCGLHALRHACATELLRKGTSLRGIADFLGHRSIRSVSVYAHCDLRALLDVSNFSLSGVL
jgi:integrase